MQVTPANKDDMLFVQGVLGAHDRTEPALAVGEVAREREAAGCALCGMLVLQPAD